MSKAVTVLAILALAGVAAVSSTSCFVHRRSGDLPTCTTDLDCLLVNVGVCDHGYCVDATSACPSPCTSCDLTDKTCEVQCNAGSACGLVKCPPGFDCTIRCGSANCGDIDCAEGTHCKIDCSGQAACGPINCGHAACEISCSGQDACLSIDCASACGCDVTCNANSGACPSMSCPMGDNGPCTRQGSAGGNCSSNPAGCDTCP